MISRLMPPLILSLLAGCAASGNGDYPSLALRPVETASQAQAPAPAPGVAPIDPALAARIDALVDEARQGDAAFSSALGAQEARIAAGARAASGSEAWILAQQALAALEASRNASTSALAAIDTLIVDQLERIATTPATAPVPGGESELRAAQTEIATIVDRQNSRIDSLTASLGR